MKSLTLLSQSYHLRPCLLYLYECVRRFCLYGYLFIQFRFRFCCFITSNIFVSYSLPAKLLAFKVFRCFSSVAAASIALETFCTFDYFYSLTNRCKSRENMTPAPVRSHHESFRQYRDPGSTPSITRRTSYSPNCSITIL